MSNEENEQTKLLREILKWIKFAGMKDAKNTLVSVLDTNHKRLVYHLSNGARGTVKIARLVGIGSNKTVSNMWQAWLKLGLGESIPVRGGSRFRRSFDLEDLGIEVPRIKSVEKEKRQAEESTNSEKTMVSKQSEVESHD